MPSDNADRSSEARIARKMLIDTSCVPDRYPHAVETVQRIETHISMLLLAGDSAHPSGWPVILDATFLTRDQREAARTLAHAVGCAFHIIDMDVAPETARDRIRARGEADASDANDRILDHQLTTFRPLDLSEHDDALSTSGEFSELRTLFESLES